LEAGYYQQFDADLSLEVPAEGFRGWTAVPVDLALERTALVSMHAWQFGPQEKVPGLYRQIEYINRAKRIMGEVYPPVLAAARGAAMPVIHVVGGGSDYFKDLPGYHDTVNLAGEEPENLPGAAVDPAVERLKRIKDQHRIHNLHDVMAGHEAVDFPSEARPLPGEPVAHTTYQLNAVCRSRGVTHLIYIGVAINWCLLMSPGGMIDMSRLGYMCSTIGQATTAVENKETARNELAKAIALWRVALHFGFVFDADDFVAALKRSQV
jgi:nicotinamidase-related amidase